MLELEVDLLSLNINHSINVILLSEPDCCTLLAEKKEKYAGKETDDEEKISVGMLPSRWRRTGMEGRKEVEYQIC